MSGDFEMGHWEENARQQVDELIEASVFDDVRGMVRVPNYEDMKYDFANEFNSRESYEQFLSEAYDHIYFSEVPFDGGEAVFEGDSYGYVGDAVADIKGAYNFFERHAPPIASKSIFTANELLIPTADASSTVEISLVEINEELIAYLAANPEKMRDLAPRKFEELVAEMWKNQGFEVTLTPSSRDGGMDVIAVRKDTIGTMMVLVECKRYAAENKVGVEIVRGLYGVVSQKNATQGVIATTSYFTKGVKDFRKGVPFRIGLADFDVLKTSLAGWKQNADG